MLVTRVDLRRLDELRALRRGLGSELEAFRAARVLSRGFRTQRAVIQLRGLRDAVGHVGSTSTGTVDTRGAYGGGLRGEGLQGR